VTGPGAPDSERHRPTRSAAAACLAVFAFAAALNLAWLGGAPLAGTTESRHAEAAREFAAGGHWLVPTVNGWPHLTKPPLTDWLAAAGILIFGPDEFGVRLGNALVAALAVALTAALARRLAGPGALPAAAIVLAVCPLHFALSRIVSIDVLLAALSAGFFLILWEATRPECRGTRRAALVAALGAVLGLGAMAKGHIALLVMFAPGLIWALSAGLPGGPGRPYRRRAGAAALGALAVLAVAAAVALPWFLYIARAFPGWLDSIAADEFGERVAGGAFGRAVPGTAAACFLLGCLPAVPLALAAVLRSRLSTFGSRPSEHEDPPSAAVPKAECRKPNAEGCLPPGALSLLLLWIAVPLTVFSLVSGQRANYVEPLLPAAAVLAGAGWVRLAAAGSPLGRLRSALGIAAAGVPIVLGLAAAGLPAVPAAVDGLRLGDGPSLALMAAGAVMVLGGAAAATALVRGRAAPAAWALGLSAAATWGVMFTFAAGYLGARGVRESALLLSRRLASGDEVCYYRGCAHGVGFYLDSALPVVDPDARERRRAGAWTDWPGHPGPGLVRSWAELADGVRGAGPGSGRGVWLVLEPADRKRLGKAARESGVLVDFVQVEPSVLLARVLPPAGTGVEAARP